MKLIATLAMAFLVIIAVGCATPGRDVSGEDGVAVLEEAKSPVEGPASGRSSAESTTVDFPNAIGAAWGASDQTSNSLSARYSPTATNSSSGGLVTGFVQGLTGQQQLDNKAAVHEALKADPALKSLADEMAWIMETMELTPDTQARLDQLRKDFITTRAAIIEGLAESGVTERMDLGNLRHLTVVGIVPTFSGHTERTPTDEEAKNLSRVITNPVSAARGEAAILGEGESREPGEEDNN